MALQRKKNSSKKTALLLSAIFSVVVCLFAAFSYVSYAWFTFQRTATVNFSNLQMSGSLEATVYRSPINLTNLSGYQLSGYTVPSSYTALVGSTSNCLFQSGEDDSYKLAPGLAKSYLFEIYNGASYSQDISLYLMSFESGVSTTRFHSTSGVKGNAMRLSEATNVYATYFPESGALASAKAFIEGYDSTYSDVFSHSEASGDSLTNLWSSSSNSLASGATGYFLVTIAFDDSNANHYNLDEENSTVGTEELYEQSDSGSSNCFFDLSIVFPSVLIAPTVS